MTTTIKYDVLYYNGKRGKKSVKYECPDFEPHTVPAKTFMGVDFPERVVSVEEKIDKWCESFDKRDWMDSNDIQIIYNWKVVSAKQPAADKKSSTELIVQKEKLTNEQIVAMYISLPQNEAIRPHFVAVYATMKDGLKGLHFEKQIDLVYKGIDVALKSSHNTLDRLRQGREKIKLAIEGKTPSEAIAILEGMRNETKQLPQ